MASVTNPSHLEPAIGSKQTRLHHRIHSQVDGSTIHSRTKDRVQDKHTRKQRNQYTRPNMLVPYRPARRPRAAVYSTTPQVPQTARKKQKNKKNDTPFQHRTFCRRPAPFAVRTCANVNEPSEDGFDCFQNAWHSWWRRRSLLVGVVYNMGEKSF